MKNNLIKFTRKSEEETFYKELTTRVRSYFTENNISTFGNRSTFIKGIIFFALTAVSYCCLLQWGDTFFTGLLFYIAFGSISLIAAFNFAHDASHNSLCINKTVNKFIFELVFNFQGSNGYLWKLRHLDSHHIFPNIEGADADLDNNALVRLSPGASLRSWHKYQHLYAPFLYLFYTLIWIFYKDFAFLFKKRHANLILKKHPGIEIIKLICYKIIYLIVFLVIPLAILDLSAFEVVACFILMHFMISLFLIFTFLISHYCMEVKFPELDQNKEIKNSWIYHQIDVSVDFHATTQWGNILFGGFNAHLAHHLFPHICHIHYPKITRIIQEVFKKYGVAYKSVSYLEGIGSHIRLLKYLGNSNMTNQQTFLKSTGFTS